MIIEVTLIDIEGRIFYLNVLLAPTGTPSTESLRAVTKWWLKVSCFNYGSLQYDASYKIICGTSDSRSKLEEQSQRTDVYHAFASCSESLFHTSAHTNDFSTLYNAQFAISCEISPLCNNRVTISNGDSVSRPRRQCIFCFDDSLSLIETLFVNSNDCLCTSLNKKFSNTYLVKYSRLDK